MITTSSADMIVLALEVLGRVQNGAPSSEDAALVSARIPMATAELSARNVYSFDTDDEFDVTISVPFSEFLAAVVAPSFNVDQVRGITIDQLRLQAEDRLRRIRQTFYGFRVEREFF